MMIGLYPNISHEEYHKIEAVSNSYLSRLSRCPAAAKVPQTETPAMLFGGAFHSLLLEGEVAFNERFVVAPQIDKRTKDGKAQWAALQELGKVVVSAEDYDLMTEMANAVIKHPFAIKCLAEGRSETSVFWNDPETGLYCKCRPDRIPDGDHGVIVDVKTTVSADKKAFAYTVNRLGYDRQAAFYIDGFNAVCSGSVDAFIFIAVEKEPPYKVACFTLSDGDISVGRMKYRDLIEREKGCREAGEWPHYDDEGLVELWMPNF
jgi:exodeoxyribonuclease VIII